MAQPLGELGFGFHRSIPPERAFASLMTPGEERDDERKGKRGDGVVAVHYSPFRYPPGILVSTSPRIFGSKEICSHVPS